VGGDGGRGVERGGKKGVVRERCGGSGEDATQGLGGKLE